MKKLIRYTKDTFFRQFEDIGYITNQLTKHDLVVNETGAFFLKHIERQANDIDFVFHKIIRKFSEDILIDEIKTDFNNFIYNLELQGFIVTGDTVYALNNSEPSFSYKMANPKTSLYDFTNKNNQDIKTDSYHFLHEKFYKTPQIFSLQIEVTSKCNERCIHCYIPNEKKAVGVNIDTELIYKVLDEARDMGTLQVTFSGGELFLHKDIHKILKKARENDFSISILSNLTLIDSNHITILKDINPSIVQVSLYSMIEEEHDLITKLKGSFKKTKYNIERLVEADIPVQISCPVMKINRNSYKDVLAYANNLRIKSQTDFIMMAQSDFNRSNLSERISINETKELLKDIIKFDKDYIHSTLDIKSKTQDIEKYKNMPICGVGTDSICLSASGKYFPCAGWQGLVLGDANKQSLSDVWNNSKQILELRKITNSSFPNCLKCDALDYCAMCLVRNFNENNGDMFKISKHFCDVAFLNKRMVEEYFSSKNDFN